MGNELLRQLLVKIRDATWFAILADETADIANLEQLSLSIRWVTKDYEIHEDFIGLVHVPTITSKANNFISYLRRPYSLFAAPFFVQRSRV